MTKVLLVISILLNVLEWPHISQDLHTFAVQHNFTSDNSRTIDIHI